jgi:hypothetical protein
MVYTSAIQTKNKGIKQPKMKLHNLKMCKSVHITVIQVELTSHVEFYSLLFHVLMHTLLCACVRMDEHISKDTVKQSHMSIRKILAAQLWVFKATWLHATQNESRHPHLHTQKKKNTIPVKQTLGQDLHPRPYKTKLGCCTSIAMFCANNGKCCICPLHLLWFQAAIYNLYLE